MKDSRVRSARLLSAARQEIRRLAPDLRRYRELLTESAALGNAQAMENLAAWMLEGLRDSSGAVIIKRTPVAAVRLLQMSATLGDRTAAFNLACCYDSGEGVRKSVVCARRWYVRAARQGVAIAAANLAVLARERGSPRAESGWLRRAATLGDLDAAITLAVRVLSRAARASERTKAIRLLGRVARSGAPDQRRDAEAALAQYCRAGEEHPRTQASVAKRLRR
jgi:TPR repeat protein